MFGLKTKTVERINTGLIIINSLILIVLSYNFYFKF